MWQQEFNEKKFVLAKNINSLRLERYVAQERLALESDVDRTLVSKIERQIGNPSLEILVKLAAALKVNVVMLLTDKNEILLGGLKKGKSNPLIINKSELKK